MIEHRRAVVWFIRIDLHPSIVELTKESPRFWKSMGTERSSIDGLPHEIVAKQIVEATTGRHDGWYVA